MDLNLSPDAVCSVCNTITEPDSVHSSLKIKALKSFVT